MYHYSEGLLERMKPQTARHWKEVCLTSGAQSPSLESPRPMGAERLAGHQQTSTYALENIG